MGVRPAGILLSVALAFFMVDAGSAQDEGRRKPQRQIGPEIIELDYSDVSPPLRDITPIPPRFQDNEEHPVKKLPHRHPFRQLAPVSTHTRHASWASETASRASVRRAWGRPARIGQA